MGADLICRVLKELAFSFMAVRLSGLLIMIAIW